MQYGRWLLRGTGGKPGYRRLLNFKYLGDLTIGALVFLLVPMPLQEAGGTVLLPLAGLLIGLSFAWGGNAQALLQTSEIENLSKHHPGGFEEYVYTFQTAILAILITLCAWGLAALGVIDRPSIFEWGYRLYPVVGTLLYSLMSLTLRACWGVVVGAQNLLIARKVIRQETGDK